MITDNAQLILGFLLGIGGIIFAVAYAYGQIKTGTTKALEESNTTLRDLIKDQDAKIKTLEERDRENARMIAELKGQVATIIQTNSDLNNLIQAALVAYFEKHPQEALKVAKKG